MVTVAKKFDAPIKLLFPKDLVAEKLEFSMLGLGDIVIPGRSDANLKAAVLMIVTQESTLPFCSASIGVSLDVLKGKSFVSFRDSFPSLYSLSLSLCQTEASRFNPLLHTHACAHTHIQSVCIIALAAQMSAAGLSPLRTSPPRSSPTYSASSPLSVSCTSSALRRYCGSMPESFPLLIVPQPALLYLVPFCLGASLLAAAISGNFTKLVDYSEENTQQQQQQKQQQKQKQKQKQTRATPNPSLAPAAKISVRRAYSERK